MKLQLYPFNELCFRAALPHSTSFGWEDELWSFAEGLPRRRVISGLRANGRDGPSWAFSTGGQAAEHDYNGCSEQEDVFSLLCCISIVHREADFRLGCLSFLLNMLCASAWVICLSIVLGRHPLCIPGFDMCEAEVRIVVHVDGIHRHPHILDFRS